MRRVLGPIAILILFAAPSLARSKPSSPPKCTDYGRGVRVCSELDNSALSRPGRSTTWRVWVEGEIFPSQVRLHNDSPGVVHLKGGDDQIVHTACRRHREVRRKVTAIGPGEAKLLARPYSPSPRQEAATIAAALAPLLARIEAEFSERVSQLPQGGDYPVAAVSELLDTTEAELLAVLSYQELAALQDYVRQQFRAARNELGSGRQRNRTRALSPPAQGIALASLTVPVPSLVAPVAAQPAPPSPGTAPQQATESIFGKIRDKIHHLYELATANDLVTSLCVTSQPASGAKFFLRPQSYDRKQETLTSGEIRNLYRGLYIYQMSKGLRWIRCLDLDRDQCGGIDLVDNDSPILECDLSARGCRRLAGPPGACP